ncbi:glycosyltransferase family 4 protein [Colwellia echini]|uniref:Glycosyltransferase family 4 protein n=1 Tax=Colwellia echini TaxID=1982103 RepID=A0ABY3MUI2_9GAMM|nr:glycosyltransferase family 4 protein [Colwellia echini]TYK64779.1 glycosyltransferase family 4 protein [Colwellia echini]
MKHIVTLGTCSKGGIDSVIQGYIDNGLFADKKHTRIKSHQGAGKVGDLFLFLKASLQLIWLSIKEKELILHCHMSYKGSFWRKLTFVSIAKLFNNRTIIHLHGSEFKDYFESRSKFTQTLLLWLIKNVDEFVVLSDSWFDYLKSISGRSVAVINNYVDIDKVHATRRKGHILFLGAFIKRKGIYDLIHAVAKLDIDYHLHLCGSGENDKVHELVDKLELNDSITFHGWINTEQKQQLLSDCELMILPTYNEGLPMVIIEAMACEIPIISTPVGAIPEVIIEGETGYLFNQGDVEEMYYKLTRVLNNDKENEYVCHNAKAFYADNFTSHVVLPKWNKLYEKVSTS